MPALARLFQNQEEQKQAIEAKVSGSIPNWINGSYVRVGPGKFDIGEITMNHFIDGYAMLSKFDIKDGKVTFHKKYLQSTAYKKCVEQKEPFFPEFATKGNIAKDRGFFSRVANTFASGDITDNDSISVYTIEGDVYAASETCHVHNVDPQTLGTGEKIDYYKVFGVHLATAHPIVDSKGDWYNIGTSFSATGAKYQVFKIPASPSGTVKDAMKKASVLATITPSWSTVFAYFHSFSMTENYIIFIEQPLLMSVMKMTDAKLKGKSIKEIMEWTPKENNRFYIINKNTGEVSKVKYMTDTPFFFFHFVNSYEQDGHIVVDVNAFPTNAVVDKMCISRLRSGDLDQTDPSRVQRFVLPIIKDVKDIAKGDNLVKLSNAKATARRDGDVIIITSEGFGEPGFEGPIINPNKQFKPHRYVYGSGSMLPGYYANALCKLDLATGETKLWRDNEHSFPGEPKFIPNQESMDEDDGVLMTTLSDIRENGSDSLVFLSAKTMEELGRAAVGSAQIPQSLHGIYIPHSSIKNGKK
jgi:carotenoid cleavage dioxygenase-like enzyme